MAVQIKLKYYCFKLLFLLSVAAFAQEVDSVATSGLYVQEGYASYYHKKFHGRKTTSGERFSNRELTAAHRALPFGTLVKVTNLKTGKWVILKVNDRGPRSKKRIIDVSYRAARHLGMLNGAGIVKVRVEELPKQPKTTPVKE